MDLGSAKAGVYRPPIGEDARDESRLVCVDFVGDCGYEAG